MFIAAFDSGIYYFWLYFVYDLNAYRELSLHADTIIIDQTWKFDDAAASNRASAAAQLELG